MPTGFSFAGRARPVGIGLPCRRAMRSLPTLNEAPHEPQKRFSGGLACRHRGHGARWSLMSPRPPVVPWFLYCAKIDAAPQALKDCKPRDIGILHTTGKGEMLRSLRRSPYSLSLLAKRPPWRRSSAVSSSRLRTCARCTARSSQRWWLRTAWWARNSGGYQAGRLGGRIAFLPMLVSKRAMVSRDQGR